MNEKKELDGNLKEKFEEITLNKVIMLNKIMELKGFSKKSELALFLEIRPNVLSNWYNRNTFDKDIILKKIPELNKIWILTGEGEMLKKKVNEVPEKKPVENKDSVLERLLDNKIERVSGHLSALQEHYDMMFEALISLVLMTDEQKKDLKNPTLHKTDKEIEVILKKISSEKEENQLISLH